MDTKNKLSERRIAQLEMEKEHRQAEDKALELIEFIQQRGFTFKEALLATEKATSILKKIRKKHIKEKVDEIAIPALTDASL